MGSTNGGHPNPSATSFFRSNSECVSLVRHRERQQSAHNIPQMLWLTVPAVVGLADRLFPGCANNFRVEPYIELSRLSRLALYAPPSALWRRLASFRGAIYWEQDTALWTFTIDNDLWVWTSYTLPYCCLRNTHLALHLPRIEWKTASFMEARGPSLKDLGDRFPN